EVDLRLGSAERLPFDDGAFDAVYATNSAQFWPDLVGGLREILRVLRIDGRAVVVVQPMWRGATEDDSRQWRDKLVAGMPEAGFAAVEDTERAMRPAPAAAAIGHRSG